MKNLLRRLGGCTMLTPMGFIYTVAIIMVILLAIPPAVWLGGWFNGTDTPWFFRMMDEARKNTQTIFSAAVVGGVVAIVPFLVNKNRNNIPDKLEKENNNGETDNRRLRP